MSERGMRFQDLGGHGICVSGQVSWCFRGPDKALPTAILRGAEKASRDDMSLLPSVVSGIVLLVERARQ